jgi:3-dehydroquinate synthase
MDERQEAEDRVVRVELGQDSYDILIGRKLRSRFQSFVSQQGYSRKCLIVSDTNVGPLYGRAVSAALEEAGLAPSLFEIPAGESSKCMAQAERIYTYIIEKGLDRRSPVFALGGGVVGDLAGFVAATYMRGVPFVQMPTSLLAQVDSSVGGKVAVDHPLGKNLIGCFYQPDAVFIDLDFMKSLPEREISTGLGEIVKYGIIYDEAFFRFLEEHRQQVLSLEDRAAVHMIARSCEIKAAVVSQDEKEAGLRRILNFGHTMAHAIEQETHYEAYNHGEAVAIGMAGAVDISVQLGLLRPEDAARITALIRDMRLPVKAESCTVDAMYEEIFHDKKTVNGRVNWVLADRIGHTVIRSDVPEDVVKKAMRGILA